MQRNLPDVWAVSAVRRRRPQWQQPPDDDAMKTQMAADIRVSLRSP